MKDTTLPTLSEVTLNSIDLYSGAFSKKIINYARFLAQPLKLGMFIPYNDKGEILEEPKNFKDFNKKNLHIYKSGESIIQWVIKCKEYQKAKDRILFKVKSYEKEGWVIWITFQDIVIKYYTEYKSFWIGTKELNQISDLEGIVQLTKTEYKRLNLEKL